MTTAMETSTEGLFPWGSDTETTLYSYQTKKIPWHQLGQNSELQVNHQTLWGGEITTSSLLLGTRQIQFVPKLVSLV